MELHQYRGTAEMAPSLTANFGSAAPVAACTRKRGTARHLDSLQGIV